MTTVEHANPALQGAASPSLLGALAHHESQLQAKLQAAQQEARDILDRARAEARKLLADAEARTIDDTGRIRRDAEMKRDSEFGNTVRAAEDRLVSVREEAARRVPKVAEEVLELFVPRGSGS